MSYFFAVVPQGLKDNDELRRLFSKFKRTMDDKDKNVRWVAADLWHVTVQYLGSMPGPRKNELLSFFENWKPGEIWQNIELRIHGVGAFPEIERARVLWLGVQKNQSLLDAQDSLKKELQALGFEDDGREYNPHLTLARFRNPFHASSLTQLGGRKHFGDYKVSEIIFFESVLQGNMPKYIPLARKNLVP